MDTKNERKLAARAKELGERADPEAFGELTGLTKSFSPLVRRLAASALGKLAGIVPVEEAVQTLHPLLQDSHPQVRQYTAKASGSFGAAAKDSLPDLRDLYIEYWGMNTNDYKIGMLKKQELYKQQGKKLISLYPKDKPRITKTLMTKLESLK